MTKKQLLQSLPALTGSDFIIYDTSEQHADKPYVLVTFSLPDENKEEYYKYQVRIDETSGYLIRGAGRYSGDSTYGGDPLFGVQIHYYDTSLNEWVFHAGQGHGTYVLNSTFKGYSDKVLY